MTGIHASHSSHRSDGDGSLGGLGCCRFAFGWFAVGCLFLGRTRRGIRVSFGRLLVAVAAIIRLIKTGTPKNDTGSRTDQTLGGALPAGRTFLIRLGGNGLEQLVAMIA